MIEGMDIETVPAATWAVFSFEYPAGFSYYTKNHARIIDEWLPASEYQHDEKVPIVEVYPMEGDHWEFWIPVRRK